ncbi:hypothetical protein N7462_006184 [Penicillium macrosclerotiorum]|uniref:uncharacterized protein n=1 Tax=Penicillium macrosclerotiorum TaxID=303699 RepID=UPI002548BDDF|nr:uncharacterized protein N7462_006184 [Penicillium macrosclerotiorum]KAJ5683019.1 hypothetical protein N7462_006184 [Penicillium macrosclerotiorum]
MIRASHPAPLGVAPERAGTEASSTRLLPQPKQSGSWSSESSPNALDSESPAPYTSFSSSDSDDPLPGRANETDEDVAGDVVGVSIGRAQSRMKARATPAEEKNRVLEQQGGYFTNVPEEPARNSGLFVSELTAEPDTVEPESQAARAQKTPRSTPVMHPATQSVPVEHRAPSGPHKDQYTASSAALPETKDTNASSQRSSFTRSLLKTSLPRRPRAWSGELKKFLPDLGSLTKRPSLSFRSNNEPNRARGQTIGTSVKRSPRFESTPSFRDWSASLSPNPRSAPLVCNVSHDEEDGDDARPISELQTLDGSSAVKYSFTRRPSTALARPPSLRRSSSDQSLYLRPSSTASSLEQRPRYENIHSQVNSRFKAIKDSLQDSSSRLLSMPTLHLQDIRPDWTSPTYPNSASTSTAERSFNKAATEHAMPPPPPRYNSQSIHPILEEAMSELTGDVVILGGYRGSILRSAKPPHRQLWVPMKVGLNLRKVDLEVGLTREDEERMEETIIPSGVLSHVGPVDVCRRLMKRLRKCENAVRGDLRVWDYGYDWRLSPELLSQRLIAFLERLPCNRSPAEGEPRNPRRGATVIAHSLGGLITRHAVNQRPDLFAGVVYAGVPQHCVNILGPLRNGDDVLLSSRVLTAQVNFTFRTSFALLPEDGHCFIDKQTKEEYRVDFFNASTWDEYHLTPCINPALPSPTATRGFKDLAAIGKRFSLGPQSSTTDLQVQDLSDSRDPDTPSTTTTTDEDSSPNGSRRTIRQISTPNPAHIAASAGDKLNDTITPQVDGLVGPVTNPRGRSVPSKISTASTIPHAAAVEYLQRTLAEVKRFKAELNFQPGLQAENKYPPAAVLYGKSVPTVYGARVVSRDAIKQQDAYDDLAFAAGDGVCLASAAMLPPGYRIIKDGLVKSDRGHVGLLGDLEGVGQCLRAIIRGRKEGVGMENQE